MRRLMVLMMLGVSTLGFVAMADPAEWQAEMQRFDAEDAAMEPRAGGVLFVGSSSIKGWDVAASFPDLKAINRGFGGSRLEDVLHHFDRVVTRYRPRTIVLYCGENDIAAGKTPERVAADYRRFVELMQEKLPEAKLVFIALKPSPLRWEMFEKMSAANAMIRAHASRQERVTYVDVVTPMLTARGLPRAELFKEDLLHLNTEGYKLWASLVGPLLAQADEAAP